jgi:hypothetical protein
MELNKYDLAEWVAELISSTSDDEICEHCMFECGDVCADCHKKQLLMERIVKKYNL